MFRHKITHYFNRVKTSTLEGNVWRNKLTPEGPKSSVYAHFWNTHLNRCEVVMSPSVHTIATLEMVVVFISRLKRGNYCSFSRCNALNSHFDNSTRLKRHLQSWNSPHSACAQWSFQAKIVPLLLFRWDPFVMCFHSLWLHQKNI